MNKSVAITALAVSALALASCSTEASNDDSTDNGAMTQTATQESPETTEETSEETSETTSAEESSSETTTTAASSSVRFDEAALKSELEGMRSEEHTSELQSRGHLVCRLLLASYAIPPRLPPFPTRRSSDLTDNGAMTQTATQESPETTEETSEETSETTSAEESSSETTTTAASSSVRFDEAALKSEREGM